MIFKKIAIYSCAAIALIGGTAVSATAETPIFGKKMSVETMMDQAETMQETAEKQMEAVQEHAMSVKDKLEARKAEFAKKADQQMQDDFEIGIQQVGELGVLERAKNIGDQAPNFTLADGSGEMVELASLLEKGPVVLIWYRGEWCPYCNIYLESIQQHADAFKDAGASVVAVSPEKPEQAMKIEDKLHLGYHVLSDEQSKVAEEYGVVYTLPEKIAEYYQNAFDLHGKNNDERNLLPIAASYVIQPDGKITYAYLNADYRERAEPSILLEEVQKLK